jgi:hypothetical protein
MFVQKLIHHRDKLLSPEEVAKREEEERDKSESAERERRFLEMQAKADEEDRETNRANIKLLEKLRIKTTSPLHEGDIREEAAVGETKKHEKDPDIQVSLFLYRIAALLLRAQSPGASQEPPLVPGAWLFGSWLLEI